MILKWYALNICSELFSPFFQEEAADEEVNKVVDEIVMGVKSTKAPLNKLGPETKEEDVDELQGRLGALKQ
jgi:hypothetical protein